MNQGFPSAASFSPLDWPVFSVHEGGFQIRFPNCPTPSDGTIERNGVNCKLTLFRHFDHATSINFSINYTDFPHTLESPHLVNNFLTGYAMAS